MNSSTHIIADAARILQIARSAKRVAVLGIRSEQYSDRPAFYVAEYLASAGVEVIPVPVYEPDVTQILGRPVIRDLTAVEGPVDIVDVFRRSEDVTQHVDALIALKPKCVWMQLGISNREAAEQLAAAGIDVVQNRCLLVEHKMARR